MDQRGLSYTEREYDYATKLDIPILPFLHANPDEIPAGKVDRDEKTAKRLQEFRARVEKSHHCKYWSGAEDLGGKVSRAMIQIFKITPRIGWVRGDQVPSQTTLRDLEKFRKQAEELQAEVIRLRKQPSPLVDGLAHGGDIVPFSFSYDVYTGPASGVKGVARPSRKIVEPMSLTWDGVFAVMGPRLLSGDGEWSARYALREKLEAIKRADPVFVEQEGHSISVADTDAFACLTQFVALGLVEVSEGNERGRTKTQWRLTPYGRDHLLRTSGIRGEKGGSKGSLPPTRAKRRRD